MENYEKLYKQALENAKRLYEQGTITESLAYIFPELKESEDEKIRKALIKGVESCKASGWTNFGNNVDIDVVLAWLEKQGESYTKKDIDDAYLKGICDAKNELEKQDEQKPKTEWSKDDEAMFQSCTGAIWAADYYLYEDKQDMEAWLKSIKDRIGG